MVAHQAQAKARRRGVDSNVLVYAHIPSAIEHEAVHAFLRDQLEDPDTVIVVTPAVLTEFVHVVTDARRHLVPATMADAIALAVGYTDRSNVDCLQLDDATFRLGMDLVARHRLGRNRITDAVLAAALRLAGVTELITCDPDDFAIFEDLTVIDPRD